MQRKLGINCDCVKDFAALQALDIIKETGFDCFFTGTRITDLATVTAIKEKAEKLGLSYEFIHAPYKGVNAMWSEDETTKAFMDSIKQAIDNAAAACVPQIILHASSTWSPPQINEDGFARYDELVDYATHKNVAIAFENMRVIDHCSALLERYKNNPYAVFCYDNGHEHCNTPEISYLEKYGKRTRCTHLHDNFGKLDNYLTVDGDLHLLPFDGNFDFAQMIKRMDENGYTGALTLEVFNTRREDYKTLTAEEFIRTCYERLKKISKM